MGTFWKTWKCLKQWNILWIPELTLSVWTETVRFHVFNKNWTKVVDLKKNHDFYNPPINWGNDMKRPPGFDLQFVFFLRFFRWHICQHQLAHFVNVATSLRLLRDKKLMDAGLFQSDPEVFRWCLEDVYMRYFFLHKWGLHLWKAHGKTRWRTPTDIFFFRKNGPQKHRWCQVIFGKYPDWVT